MITSVLMLLFLVGWAWAWSPLRKPEFDAAASLPLEGDEAILPPSAGAQT